MLVNCDMMLWSGGVCVLVSSVRTWHGVVVGFVFGFKRHEGAKRARKGKVEEREM